MHYAYPERSVVSIGPDGTEIRGTTAFTPDTCCIVWAWSESQQCWMRQSDFTPYSQAGKQLAELMAECPNVRPVLAPARQA